MIILHAQVSFSFYFFSCLSDFALVPGTHPFQFCHFYGLEEIELASFLTHFHSVRFWRGFFIIKKRVSNNNYLTGDCLAAEQNTLRGSEHQCYDMGKSHLWSSPPWVVAVGKALGLRYVVCSVHKLCKKTMSIIANELITIFPFQHRLYLTAVKTKQLY